MERQTIQVGSFEVNCTILAKDGLAWVVDPGQDADYILEKLAKKNLVPAALLLTHAHFDHIGGIPGIQKAYPDIPVYVHPNDRAVIAHPLNQLPPEYPPVGTVSNLMNTDELAGANGVEVIETPGHTPGGVCYYFPGEKLLLSGDTLFAGSIGRTDLPGGDMAVLMNSLKKLKALPDNTTVIPGHGPLTTIAQEKGNNPFLR